MPRPFAGVIFYCLSATQRHEACLDVVLAHGASVDNVNNEGMPVFLHACETAADNEQMCALLLERGADPNCRNEVRHAVPVTAQLMAAGK